MKPVSGKKIFNALRDKNCIILAANVRIVEGVAAGIFRAAKDSDAAVLIELAKSECNQRGGYTGLTPETFARRLSDVNKEIGHDVWALHGDHIGIKEGTLEEMADTKELVAMQIASGYTSFAIDASHLFNFEGATVEEELAPNLKATIEMARFIAENVRHSDFGLEVEVGEIGRKNSGGMVLTTPEEAVVFIRKLKEAGVNPDLLAIANGSTHGNVYDGDGNLIPLVSIDIELTKRIAKSLRDAGFGVKIAQHGITGTPLELIREKFPKGDILKGNVGTLFQNIVFGALQIHERELYDKMFAWVIENKPIPGKKPNEVFGKNGKFALKVFFDRIYAMSDECKAAIETTAYEETKKLIEAFNAKGTASIVRKTLS
ncbi:fructose-bisphosphate aldolase [Candidatus Micrarchaeota archaeon CG1_02_51_15]|nr:MAG: fructose-bisphosphate aldolase [Candidatus Micrarchaeota archaeon CG1_02_51_15]